jgi:phosphoglucomutase
MDYMAVFERWRSAAATLDEPSRQELDRISFDVREIEERFGQDLAFGTGGMRGKLGVGTGRMNRYTVRRATHGYAAYLLACVPGAREAGVVIARDPRRGSTEFADETARVLASHGIRVWLFDDIRPTPLLSYAVRELAAAGGIVITASHNPPEYNGYKAYDPNGVQLLPDAAEEVADRARVVDDYLSPPGEVMAPVEYVDAGIDESYVRRVLDLVDETVLALVPREARTSFGLIYTPLHGTGHVFVPHVLRELGFESAQVVAEQSVPDGAFPTVTYPNPEDPGAFEMAIAQAQDVAEARPEIILATDPDCDRVGVAVWDRAAERYRVLTGNQTGVLLADFLIESARASGQDLSGCAIIKTIVSTEMATAIAAAAGVRVIDTLTGFKYIGEQIGEIERAGGCFLLGFEESCGYLAGAFVRDKDAVIASALIACAAVRQRLRGRTLLERLDELFREYGYFHERLISVAIAASIGAGEAMESLRCDTPDSVGGFPVSDVHDYLTGWTKRRGTGVRVPIDLPRENCIQLILTECGKVTLRPSGTEPKLKLYIAVRADSADEAAARADAIESATRRLLPIAPER